MLPVSLEAFEFPRGGFVKLAEKSRNSARCVVIRIKKALAPYSAIVPSVAKAAHLAFARSGGLVAIFGEG
jgi:hypothetical protein